MHLEHLHALKEGELLNPNRRQWPETTHYRYCAGIHALQLFRPRPTDDDIWAVRTGRCRIGFVVCEPVILFLYRIEGSTGWCYEPYSIHFLPVEQRVLPEPAHADDRARVEISLINSRNGVVLGLRSLSVSPLFTKTFHAAVNAQLLNGFRRDEFDRTLSLIERQYPQAETLLPVASLIEVGGVI